MELTSSSSLIEHRSASLLGLPITVNGLTGYWANKTMMLAPGGSSCSCSSSASAQDTAKARERAAKIKRLKAAGPKEANEAIRFYTRWIDRHNSIVNKSVLRGINRYLKRKPLSRRLMGKDTGKRRTAKIYQKLLYRDDLSENGKLVILYALLYSRHINKTLQHDVVNCITEALLVNDLVNGQKNRVQRKLSSSIALIILKNESVHATPKHIARQCANPTYVSAILITILNNLFPQVIRRVIQSVCQDDSALYLQIIKKVVHPIITKVNAKQNLYEFDDVLVKLEVMLLSDKALNKHSSNEGWFTRKEKQRRIRTQLAVALCADWIKDNKAQVIALAQEGIGLCRGHKSSLRFFKLVSTNARECLIYQKLLNRDDLDVNVKFVILYALLLPLLQLYTKRESKILYPKRTPETLQNNVARYIIAAYLESYHEEGDSQGRIKAFPLEFLAEIMKRIAVSTVNSQDAGPLQQLAGQLQRRVYLIAADASRRCSAKAFDDILGEINKFMLLVFLKPETFQRRQSW